MGFLTSQLCLLMRFPCIPFLSVESLEFGRLKVNGVGLDLKFSSLNDFRCLQQLITFKSFQLPLEFSQIVENGAFLNKIGFDKFIPLFLLVLLSHL